MSQNHNHKAILVIEDDQSTRTYLSRFLSSLGYTVECADSGEQAVMRLNPGYSPNVIVLDLLLPGMHGREVLAHLKKHSNSTPVVVLSGVGEIRSVVEAMKMGASDYVVKPFEEEELELAIENVLEKQELKEEIRNLQQQIDKNSESEDIVSGSPKMIRIREIAKQVADTDVPVLISGESGVGKEVIARFIHNHSHRRYKPFVKVNCAALPHDLLESELFGHERGAFTGALLEKPGKFELAGKGTLLLDEITEMNTHLQAKLLHVLQDNEFSRLGGKRSYRAECRILATTNRVLSQAVAQGDFREDLYYRINVIRIEVPPLRERRDDIPLLYDYFLQKYRGRYNAGIDQLPRELVEVILAHSWPGNVRQLENAIKRYLILPDPELVLSELGGASIMEAEPSLPKDMQLKEVSTQAAERAEREMVLGALAETNWNRKRAAQRLGICYKALLNKLKKWDLKQPLGGQPPVIRAS